MRAEAVVVKTQAAASTLMRGKLMESLTKTGSHRDVTRKPQFSEARLWR